jgi:hypothetical protein
VRSSKIPPPSEHLLLCGLLRPTHAMAQVRACLGTDVNWGGLLAAAAEQGVLPLLWQRLEGLSRAELPWDRRVQLREEFKRNAHRNFFLAAELLRILAALCAHGVRATPHKGPVLALQAYGDLALRQIADLDIVVPQREIVEAHRVLVSLVFRSENPELLLLLQPADRIPGQYAYRSENFGVYVELHTEATLRYMPCGLDLEALLARRDNLSIAGHTVRVFSAEDTLILLAVHGAKHLWNRLGWIYDIANLAQTPDGIDWELSGNLANRMRSRRMWLLGLSLAREVLDAPLPEPVGAWIRQDKGVVWLRERVQAQLLGESLAAPSLWQRLLFRINSCETIAEGLRQCARVTTRPTEEDWSAYPLPVWLEPLYAVLRPWRLLRNPAR